MPPPDGSACPESIAERSMQEHALAYGVVGDVWQLNQPYKPRSLCICTATEVRTQQQGSWKNARVSAPTSGVSKWPMTTRTSASLPSPARRKLTAPLAMACELKKRCATCECSVVTVSLTKPY